MLFERSKIVGGSLDIIPIERRDGEKRRDLYRHLKAGRMRAEAPVVNIEAVIGFQDDIIAQEIVKPKSNGQFQPLGGQLLDGILTVRKIDPVKGQPQIACLFHQVNFNTALHPRIEDLGIGKGC